LILLLLLLYRSISLGDSKWWSNPKLTAEIFNFEKRHLDNYPNEEKTWRIRRDKNLDNNNEIPRSIYQDSKESHDRGKRRRRSFIVDLNYSDNRANIPENKSHQISRMIKYTLGNITRIRGSEDLVSKLNSTYLDNDKNNSMNALTQIPNISESHFLKGESFSNDYFINLTIIPLMANKTEISGSKYPLKSYLSDHSIDSGSLRFAKSNKPQTYSLEHSAINNVSSTS